MAMKSIGVGTLVVMVGIGVAEMMDIIIGVDTNIVVMTSIGVGDDCRY